MSLPDPDTLFITRRRKKWKFAHFDSYANCFSLGRGGDPKALRTVLKKFFANDHSLTLELAAGNAQFSLELAKRHPEQNFIAVDVKSDRLYTSAKQALEEGVPNIAFLRCQLESGVYSSQPERVSGSQPKGYRILKQVQDDKPGVLESIFGKNSVDEIWLTFPDPYPRKRSAKHRLTHPYFLTQYQAVLKPQAKLRFKTDNRMLFLWSLERLVAQKWGIEELSFDLHESGLSEEYKIMTYYEQRFTKEGVPINYATFSLSQ